MVRQLTITTLLLVCGTALAAEDTAQRARHCAGIADSLERLVCYDGLFREGQAVLFPAEADAAAATVRAPPPVEPPTAALPVPLARPATEAPADVADFGAEQLRGSASREEQQQARALTAKVTGTRETRRNVFRVTLDNGQIWQQMDMDSLFHVQVGDTVEISRGRLGGYRMGRTSRGGSAWVRVNRLK